MFFSVYHFSINQFKTSFISSNGVEAHQVIAIFSLFSNSFSQYSNISFKFSQKNTFFHKLSQILQSSFVFELAFHQIITIESNFFSLFLITDCLSNVALQTSLLGGNLTFLYNFSISLNIFSTSSQFSVV
jgi:hypothetical protein